MIWAVKKLPGPSAGAVRAQEIASTLTGHRLNPATDTIYVVNTRDDTYVVNTGDDTVSVIKGATCNGTNTSGCGRTPPTIPAGEKVAAQGSRAPPDRCRWSRPGQLAYRLRPSLERS